jgi:hypothetical protein
MRTKKTSVSSQLLILLLAGLVMGFMLQMAQAQTLNLGQSLNQAQVLQTNVPRASLGDTLKSNTSLGYYHQFLGPTVSGPNGETYNVFVEGKSPYQSFHAANIRYSINSNWAVGATLAATTAYGDSVTNRQTGFKTTNLRDEFYNARAFVSLPAFKTKLGSLFTTVSYEAPTSVVSRQNDMQYGGVIAQSFAFSLPSVKFTAGVSWQYYRMVYKDNVQNIPANAYFQGSVPEKIARQTTIVSGGPYMTYRHNDNWGMNSSMIFDWDQRGNQTGTGSFNNNLPDRARLGVSYFPSKLKQIANVGLFTQALVKYTSGTHAVGAEFALKF